MLNEYTGISTATLKERLDALRERWLVDDEFEGGGSPRESLDYQMSDIEGEIARRAISAPNKS